MCIQGLLIRPRPPPRPPPRPNLLSHTAFRAHRLPSCTVKMVLKVELATEADAQRSADIESVAYGPSPLGAALFPPAPPPSPNTAPAPAPAPPNSSRAEQLVALLREDPVSCRWVKVVDTEIADPAEAMVSFACWYFYEKESPVPGPETWGPGRNPDACDVFFGGMRLRRNARFEGRPFACKLIPLCSPPFPVLERACPPSLSFGRPEVRFWGVYLPSK